MWGQESEALSSERVGSGASLGSVTSEAASSSGKKLNEGYVSQLTRIFARHNGLLLLSAAVSRVRGSGAVQGCGGGQ